MVRQLHKLEPQGRDRVEELIQQEERVTDYREELHNHATPTDIETALDALSEKLESVRSQTTAETQEPDVEAVAHVHQDLDLTRRQARQEPLWYWLASVEFPEFVYHRWGVPDDSKENKAEKFLSGSILYGNAIRRLWWTAELTHKPDDSEPYAIAKKALSTGAFTDNLLQKSLGRYRPAAVAIVDELHGEKNIQSKVDHIDTVLAGYTLELMSEDEIRALVRREKDECNQAEGHSA